MRLVSTNAKDGVISTERDSLSLSLSLSLSVSLSLSLSRAQSQSQDASCHIDAAIKPVNSFTAQEQINGDEREARNESTSCHRGQVNRHRWACTETLPTLRYG